MHNSDVNSKMRNSAKGRSPWDLAIADAEDRIKALRKSIKIFTGARDSGEKWRGDLLPQSDNHVSEQQHAS